MRLKKLLVAGLTVSALVLAACSADDEGEEAGAQSEESSATDDGADEKEATGAQPDLDGIPDVVAEVNGEEISKDEFVPAYERQFQQSAAQAQMSGQQPDEDQLKEQVADRLVAAELLDQEADERGITATDKQVDKELTEIASGNQMSAEEFLAALEEQGMSEDEVMSQVTTQVKVDQLLEDEAGDLSATRAELKELYDSFAAQQKQAGQKAPPFKQVRSQLEEQVRSQKMNSTADTLLKKLRKDADITIHV